MRKNSLSVNLYKEVNIPHSMNQATRVNNTTTLEFDIDRSANIVTVRPVRRAGDNVEMDTILSDIAEELQRRVINYVRGITHWGTQRIAQQVTGVLQMNDTNDVTRASTEGIKVRDITLDTIMDIFGRGLGAGS